MSEPDSSSAGTDAEAPGGESVHAGDRSHGTETDSACSWLFVPGNRPDRFERAASSGADMVILDLEDAVPAGHKPAAREAVRTWLRKSGQACVRINAGGSRWFEDDVATLVGLPGLRAVMVPKAEDRDVFTDLQQAFGPNVVLVPLVETAVGMSRVNGLATAAGVTRLAFGSIDFALDIGASEDSLSLLFARSSLVLGSRLAGLPAPLDGVTTQLRDVGAVRRDAEHALKLGFGGKLCIHPDQVQTVNAGFRPSEEQLRWARTVLEQVADRGASQVDGHMVDTPVLSRARRLLNRSAVVPEH